MYYIYEKCVMECAIRNSFPYLYKTYSYINNELFY